MNDNKGIWADEYVGIYTADKKRLLKVPNVKRYQILEGCEETDKHAFDDCMMLECLYVPESYSVQAAEDTFNNMPNTVENFCHWDRPDTMGSGHFVIVTDYLTPSGLSSLHHS